MHLIVIGVRMKLDCVTHEHAWDVTGVCLFTPFLRHSAKLIKNCRFRPTRPTCIWHSCLGWRQNPIFLKTIPQSLHFFKKNNPPQTVATARIVPKICQGKPPHLAHTVPDFIQIGSLSTELLLNALRPFLPHRVFPI